MLKSAGFNFASKLLSAALNFSFIILISNSLGSAERGKCAFYLTIIVIILSISEMAGGATFAYLMNKFKPQAIQKLHSRWLLFPSLLVPILFYLFDTIDFFEMLLIIIGGWFHGKWNMQQHILLGFRCFKRFNLSIILAPIITMGFFIILEQLGFVSGYSYLITLIFSWAAIFFLNINFIGEKFYKLAETDNAQPATIKDIIGSGILNQLSHIVSLINNRFIFFLIPAMQLGLWSNVLTLTESLFMVPGSIGQILYAELASQKNNSIPKTLLKMVVIINGLFMAMGIVVFTILPDSFWAFIFGNSFIGLKPQLLIILPGAALFSFYLLASYIQSAFGNFLHNLTSLLFGFLFNLSGSIYLYFKGNYSIVTGIWLLFFSWFLTTLFAGIKLFKSRIIQPI